MSMKYINKMYREELHGDLKVRSSKHLSQSTKDTLKMLIDYQKKGEVVELGYCKGFKFVTHITALDPVIRDLKKEKSEDPLNYNCWVHQIKQKEFHWARKDSATLTDDEYDDMFWDCISLHVVNLLQKRELN
mgnify:CR=1 FL=1|tara:strand:- start:96 stop:491 length:396 start_codon:yes stop_codon:yes gene_type:complete